MKNSVFYGVNDTSSWDRNGGITKHAEVDLILKINGWKNKPKYIDIFVFRLSKTGNLGESKPCIHCLSFMKKCNVNIRYIYYSTKTGIIREKLNNMFSCHVCRSRK